MGLSVHRFFVTELPDNEGVVSALLQTEEEPNEELVLSQPIDAYVFVHGDCSPLRFVRVSNTKGVLCCNSCLLRIPLPPNLKTLHGLRDFFSRS